MMSDLPLFQLRRKLLPEWTVGVLMATGRFRHRTGNQRLYTLELPWDDNKPFVSCISPRDAFDAYFVKPDNTGRWRFFKVYENDGISEVDGRSYIELHPMQSYLGSEGCIGVSTEPATNAGIFLNHKENCRDALGTLRTWIRGYPGFYLEVVQ